jgi:hypothetical protein
MGMVKEEGMVMADDKFDACAAMLDEGREIGCVTMLTELPKGSHHQIRWPLCVLI